MATTIVSANISVVLANGKEFNHGSKIESVAQLNAMVTALTAWLTANSVQ